MNAYHLAMQFRPFLCPACGGRHFGRDTGRLANGAIGGLATVRCHDERKQGCKWRGEWPPPIVLEPSPEGGYTVHAPSLPGCVSEGDTLEEAQRNIADAVMLYLEAGNAPGS